MTILRSISLHFLGGDRTGTERYGPERSTTTSYVGMIRNRIQTVEARINAACIDSRRSREDITLVAVTKTMNASTVHKAITAGLTNFGENRIQEAQTKIPAVNDGRWHLIGHLQRNKARTATQIFSLIHSVDSERLAQRLDNAREDRACAVLIQVNLTQNSSQGGVEPTNLRRLAMTIDRETSLELHGLMTIGPMTASQSTIRSCFQTLHNLRNELRNDLPNQPFNELSMGMTNDFELAISEGSTIIRVGRAIFGDPTPPSGH